MKICIITGGTIEPDFALEYLGSWQPDCIIAADHGLAFCHEQGIAPDFIVGDFDSTEPEILSAYRDDGTVPIDIYPAEKDMTDTNIAIHRAVDLGAEEVIILGASGTRLDHTLSNIFCLRPLCRAGVRASIVDANNRVTMLEGGEHRLRREEQFGNRISFFPFQETVKGVTLRGVRYPVDDAEITFDNGGMFVSNEITEEEAQIRWKSGVLLMMETRD